MSSNLQDLKKFFKIILKNFGNFYPQECYQFYHGAVFYYKIIPRGHIRVSFYRSGILISITYMTG
jgi:hypothetical protein